MRVYDIALMLIRGTVAMSFVREFITLGTDSVRFLVLPAMLGNFDGLGAGRPTFMFTPIAAVFASLIILVFSKPLARFASKLSATSDMANQFWLDSNALAVSAGG